jgi:hypothetical protein
MHLMSREEVAECAENAYVSLPIPDATSLLFYKDTSDLVKFAQQVPSINSMIFVIFW